MESLIPTIDLSPYFENPNSPAASDVVRAVRAACTNKGFFQIVGHGISPEMQREAFAAAKAFFALPAEEKVKIDRLTAEACGRGYECFASQKQQTGKGKGDNKEGFYMSFDIPPNDERIKKHPYVQSPNQWPSSDAIPDDIFKEPMQRYHAALINLTRGLLAIMVAGLPGVPFSFFDEFFADYPIAFLSPKHYPPIPEGTDLEAISCGEHTDFGAVTLLLQDRVSGLEIKDGDNWVPVPPVEYAYVVNIGDMFQKWTRGLYRSTLHRVVPVRGGHRYSIPFFFDGNPAFRLVPFDGEREGDFIETVEDHLIWRNLKLAGKA